MENKLSNSSRKFVRSEKARIRRQFFDVKKQKEMIDNLYKSLLGGEKTELQKTEIKAKAVEKKPAKKPAKTAKTKKAKTKA